jgi:hypothetical protein
MQPATPIADALKAQLKQQPERYPDSSRIRLHRAISWLRRAEREDGDADARFIFLWITFNAAYASEFGAEDPERVRFRQFIAQLVAVDTRKCLHQAVFERFSGPIRALIENRFVFEPFWRALREHDASPRWEAAFASSRKAALAAVLKGQTETVLSIVFDRLYVLRNQLIHGGATWASSLNRAQVKDGARILMTLVPAIIELMLDHPELDVGDILYPVV